MNLPVTLSVNGETYPVDIAPDRTLLDVLRNELDLTGSKEGCGTGDCGCCAVLLDGTPVNSCLMLAVQAEGRAVTTIEGIARDGLHPLQTAFVEHGAAQCGFCIPGFVVTAKALLDENPTPSRAEIRAGLASNLCRCTGYTKIVDAVEAAAASMRGEPSSPR
ncbi:MAG TPA: (2Fe-2S)-binding protein [Dehalococcoidia bacterium]|nr:(2Fe-2S)-binding protein [Dehalococcoidia bacterium]